MRYHWISGILQNHPGLQAQIMAQKPNPWGHAPVPLICSSR